MKYYIALFREILTLKNALFFHVLVHLSYPRTATGVVDFPIYLDCTYQLLIILYKTFSCFLGCWFATPVGFNFIA